MGKLFHFGNRSRCAHGVVTMAIVTTILLQQSTAECSEKLEQLAQRVGVRILADATSDRDNLKASQSQIPFSKMSSRSQQRARYILGNLSQYRRMPCLQYEVNPGMYQYLINHPDVGISTWRVMGISKLQMFQTGEFEYEASATDGSKGIADILWRDADQCLFIVQGSYNSPVLPGAIEASALVWLRYRFVKNREGKTMVNQQVETFITFPSQAVDTLARLATVLTNTILDRNVLEVSLYARMMSTASQKEPEWIEQVAQRMDGVLPQRRIELVQVSRGINPNGGKMLPSAVAEQEQRLSHLPRSGSFRSFENSMHQVNTHVPLVAGEVRHTPSYGKSIGESNPYMAKPHQYNPPEAQKAIAAQRERQRRTEYYNQYYGKPNESVVPPVETAGVAATAKYQQGIEAVPPASELPTVALPRTAGSTGAYGKSSSGARPVSPSAPLGWKARKSSAAKATTESRNAKPVSKSKPLYDAPNSGLGSAAPLPPQQLSPLPPVNNG